MAQTCSNRLCSAPPRTIPLDRAVTYKHSPLYPPGTAIWDTNLAGFGVKVLPSGKKRYIVKYRVYGGGRSAAQRWMTLGTHGEVPLEQARDHAQQILAAIKCGEDPQGNAY